MKHILLSLATMAIVASCSTNKLQYPEAPADNTVDDYFGVQVADPYRPLENDTSAATLKWVEEERALTESYLSKIPFRKDIRERLKTLYDYKKPGMPSKKDGDRKSVV